VPPHEIAQTGGARLCEPQQRSNFKAFNFPMVCLERRLEIVVVRGTFSLSAFCEVGEAKWGEISPNENFAH
jgi:hypothetical protein